MNSVLFFIENGWAFGTIHHGLIKRLWEHRIYANLLDWRLHYSGMEHHYFRHRYRQVCTTIDGITPLLGYNWSPTPGRRSTATPRTLKTSASPASTPAGPSANNTIGDVARPTESPSSIDYA
jgi:hypothetical protein